MTTEVLEDISGSLHFMSGEIQTMGLIHENSKGELADIADSLKTIAKFTDDLLEKIDYYEEQRDDLEVERNHFIERQTEIMAQQLELMRVQTEILKNTYAFTRGYDDESGSGEGGSVRTE
jgi:hypothetical protein